MIHKHSLTNVWIDALRFRALHNNNYNIAIHFTTVKRKIPMQLPVSVASKFVTISSENVQGFCNKKVIKRGVVKQIARR